MFDFYYNQSLRKLTVAFGSLFNEIYVSRENSDGTTNQRIRVPLTYGPKEKFQRRLTEQSGISDDTKIQLSLPRMGFEISSLNYDPTRHLNKTIERTVPIIGDENSRKTTFQEVPYNLGFSLYIFTRTMTDMLQIIEQIVPYFSPEFISSLNLNEIDTKLDVPVVLGNVAIQEDYEGNFLDRRLIAANLNFDCKTRLYSKIRGEDERPIILDTEVNIPGLGIIGITGSTGESENE